MDNSLPDWPLVAIRSEIGLKSFKRWTCSDGMSQTSTVANRYNEATPEVRTTQLRNAKVEEGRIAELVKYRFESLSSDIQGKMNSVNP